MTGKQLKKRRKAAKVTGAEVAAKAGWSHRARVAQIEALASVSDTTAERYLLALEQASQEKE